MRDLVYANIADRRRQQLHARVASASRVAQRSATARARHLLRSGSEDAIEALEDAADAAVRCFDDPGASEHLHAALRACGTLPRRAPLRGEASSFDLQEVDS